MADSVFRGTVTRVTALGVFLTIPDLGGPSVEYGPAPGLLPPRGAVTGSAGGPAHTHPIAYAYAPGDRVVVSTASGVLDDLVVLGRLP